MPFKGEVMCAAHYKSGKNAGKPCVRKAYYAQDREVWCGIHSKKGVRVDLPENPRADEIRAEKIAAHSKSWESAATANRAAGRQGAVAVAKLKMYQATPHRDGYLTVFPNINHGDRKDGLGCPALSAMSLGPVEHGQPDLPPARNLENFYQGSKCYRAELLRDLASPGPTFFEAQLAMFEDETPHRHKGPAKKTAKNPFAFWVWRAPGGELKKFSGTECRQFYCTFYERLAKKQPDFKKLLKLLKVGCNLQIVGYSGYDLTPPAGVSLPNHLLECYDDPVRDFSHELVLFTMLTCAPEDYPWRANTTEEF